MIVSCVGRLVGGADAAQAQGMVDGVVRKMQRDAGSSARPKANRLGYAQREIEIL